MSCISGPNNITSGLILELDAANSKSYNYSENLIGYSEQFDTGWNYTVANMTISANTVNAPNLTFTADKLVPTSTLTTKAIEYYSVGIHQVGIPYTLSVYAKASGYSKFRAWFGVTGAGAQFNLNTGTIISYGSTTATITSVGNGWYRCSSTYTQLTTASDAVRFYIIDPSTNADTWTSTADGVSGIYFWGAQFEKGAYCNSYTKTTNGTTITRSQLWNDLSGNVYNATMTNNSGYGGQTSFSSSGFFDFSNNSPSTTSGAFAGNGFTMANQVIPLSGSFTISAFIKRSVTTNPGGDRETIFSNTGSGDGWRFGIGSTGSIYYLIGGAGGVGYQEGSLGGTTLTDGNWHMMTAVFDRAATFGTYTIYGYVDGVQSGTATITAGTNGNIAFTAANPGIGYKGCCDVYAGLLSLLHAYNRALTANEVSQLFNCYRGRFAI